MEDKDFKMEVNFLRNYISALESDNDYLQLNPYAETVDDIREQIEQNELIIGHFRKIKKMLETNQQTISNQTSKINTLEEQVKMFIPRRRVTRVYKMLGKILQKDIPIEELEKQLKETNVDDIIDKL